MEPHVAQQFAQHVHKSRSATNAEICHSSMAQASAKQLCAASCGSFPQIYNLYNFCMTSVFWRFNLTSNQLHFYFVWYCIYDLGWQRVRHIFQCHLYGGSLSTGRHNLPKKGGINLPKTSQLVLPKISKNGEHNCR